MAEGIRVARVIARQRDVSSQGKPSRKNNSVDYETSLLPVSKQTDVLHHPDSVFEAAGSRPGAARSQNGPISHATGPHPPPSPATLPRRPPRLLLEGRRRRRLRARVPRLRRARGPRWRGRRRRLRRADVVPLLRPVFKTRSGKMDPDPAIVELSKGKMK